VSVNEAITTDASSAEVRFYLTRSPYCSSTLQPDHALLANFFGAERFQVQRETTAPAVTLNDVFRRLEITRVDWIKLDTQGTDRRIYESIEPAVRSRILAVDLEPGLRGAYMDEDLFGDVHRTMVGDGFWLSHMQVKGMVRMRQDTLDNLRAPDGDIDRDMIQRAVRTTPGWVEVRYLRSIESLEASGAADRRDFALLWAIADGDAQHGFALDLVAACERRFGADETSCLMRGATTARIRGACEAAQKSVRQRMQARVRSLTQNLVHKVLHNRGAAATLSPTKV